MTSLWLEVDCFLSYMYFPKAMIFLIMVINVLPTTFCPSRAYELTLKMSAELFEYSYMWLAVSSVCWTLEEVYIETEALTKSFSEWSVRSTPVWTLSLAHSQDSLSSLSQVIKVKLSTKGYYTPRLLVVWWLYGTNWKVSSGLHVYSSLNGISEHLWTKSYMDLWLNLSSIHGYRLSVQVATLPALLTQ